MTWSSAIAIGDLAAGHPVDGDGYVRLAVSDADWRSLALGCAEGRHDLSALWYDDGRMRMALVDPWMHVRAIVSYLTRDGTYLSVGAHHAPAIRLERAMRDLYGTDPDGLPDKRPWFDHAAWPKAPPTRHHLETPLRVDDYPFLPVRGEGMHQIPVGPVHAGIIEPGHFRFTANGETIIRLEERLGYVHKGVEAQCVGKTIEDAARIVARISGDSTVAYSFAFARAVENALNWQPPLRAEILRGVMAELERMSHHINDVGAVCNDAAVAAILARCTLIREDILQTVGKIFGHRMMMDRIIPGGVTTDIDSDDVVVLRNLLRRVEDAFRTVVRVYDELPSLQDRTVKTGFLKPELVRQFAAGGHVGRASGRPFDARAVFPYPPYDSVTFDVPSRTAGDVDARVWIRIDEVRHSASIIRQLLDMLTRGPIHEPSPTLAAGDGAALVEAFRGDVFLTVRLDEAGCVAHLHARDASWFQWPLLEACIEGNIVADFPLCNKSFNCSYSGHDL
jgi:Ni,Fe-hydrogenase III large subunit/Ni,Fe-hydrogenase III component G